MSHYYCVTLPVKAHVKKFIAAIEGQEIHWKGTSPFCMLIRAYLVNDLPIGYSKSRLLSATSTRTAEIKILVPVARKGRVGTSVSADNVILINRLLEDWFEKTFLAFVQANVKINGRYRGYKDAIEAFASTYSIELDEDITLDALVKMEMRNRKKSEKKVSTNVHSLYTPHLVQVC